MAFIDRGAEILSSARDGTVRKWSCGGGENITTLTLPDGSANCFALNAEKSLVIAGTDQGYVYVYDLRSKNVVSSKNQII